VSAALKSLIVNREEWSCFMENYSRNLPEVRLYLFLGVLILTGLFYNNTLDFFLFRNQF
jgi:hypothetical protein